ADTVHNAPTAHTKQGGQLPTCATRRTHAIRRLRLRNCMNIPASPANSADLERDARLVNARHEGIKPGDIAIGVIIGRTSEFFDFFVYAIASVLVFPALVFPY